jgi:hypothetical protein
MNRELGPTTVNGNCLTHGETSIIYRALLEYIRLLSESAVRWGVGTDGVLSSEVEAAIEIDRVEAILRKMER